MTLAIDVHPRGLIISVPPGIKRSVIGQRIRGAVGSQHVLSFQGEFVVPEHAAPQLAEEFDDTEVVWSEKAWQKVEAYRDLSLSLEVSRLEVAEALANPRRALEGYDLLERLDEHQIDAVAAMTTPSLVGLGLFDEQGLGKTFMALCAFDRLRKLGRTDRLLVIAPKSVLASWRDDVKKLFGDTYATKVAVGSREIRRRRIQSHFDILLCSYEGVVAELHLLETVVRRPSHRYMLVVDESYFVKNPDARRSKAVACVRKHCDRAILLCGTPAPNSARDLIHQLDLADTGAYRANKETPHSHEEVYDFVQEALKEVTILRRLKTEALPDLPVKSVEKVFIPLSPIQQALYDRAFRELVIDVKSVDERQFGINLTSFLARRSALSQICSHPGRLFPLYDEVPAKLLALDTLLHDLVEKQKRKVVIWSFYRHSLAAIAERFKRYGVVRVDGSVPSFDDRVEAIRRFRDDESIQIFLGNAAAAGTGLTLTAAHHAIYESFSNQAAHYMQSVDRIHRRGQEQEVSIQILLAQGTIENREYTRITSKEQKAQDLLGDKVTDVMTRERFLYEIGASEQ